MTATPSTAADPRARRGGPGRRLTPAMARMVERMCTIVDESVVYEVSLESGERAAMVRRQLLRAAHIAGVEIAIRRAPSGFYVGLMTESRRAARRRGRRHATETADGSRD